MKHAEAAQVVMAPVIQAVIPQFTARVWEDMSAQFCTTFWSLTMYDLYVPEHLYQKEIKKLKDAPAKLSENKDLNSARRKKEAERLNTLMERLQVLINGSLIKVHSEILHQDEEKRHKEHVERVMARLRQEKDTWFLKGSARFAQEDSLKTLLNNDNVSELPRMRSLHNFFKHVYSLDVFSLSR